MTQNDVVSGDAGDSGMPVSDAGANPLGLSCAVTMSTFAWERVSRSGRRLGEGQLLLPVPISGRHLGGRHRWFRTKRRLEDRVHHAHERRLGDLHRDDRPRRWLVSVSVPRHWVGRPPRSRRDRAPRSRSHGVRAGARRRSDSALGAGRDRPSEHDVAHAPSPARTGRLLIGAPPALLPPSAWTLASFDKDGGGVLSEQSTANYAESAADGTFDFPIASDPTQHSHSIPAPARGKRRRRLSERPLDGRHHRLRSDDREPSGRATSRSTTWRVSYSAAADYAKLEPQPAEAPSRFP